MIGDAIRHCRQVRGVSQQELAASCHISASYLCLIEQGKRVPNMSVLKDIAAGLGLSFALLVLMDRDEAEGADSEIVEIMRDLTQKFLSELGSQKSNL